MAGLARKLLATLWDGLKQSAADRRRVRVTIRRGDWLPGPGQPPRDCYFIGVRNLSDAGIGVADVWFDCVPRAAVERRQRRLPVELGAGEDWETWLEADKLPATVRADAFPLARVRLASGTVITPARA